MDEAEVARKDPPVCDVKNLGDLIEALSKLAGEHGKDIPVGFSVQGKVGAVTRAQQWSVYNGPLCSPGTPPQPTKYIHLFSTDWV